MAGQITFRSDDHVVLVNGIPVAHYLRGRIQPDTGGRISMIEVADGIIGSNVPPSARSRPGSGSFTMKTTSPDGTRLARLSSEGEPVSVSIRVVKNFKAYSYKQLNLAHAWLGPVSLGGDTENPDVEVTFQGHGYDILDADQ